MRDRGMSYTEAALDAGFHHSDLRPKQRLERLPYYGRVLDRYTGASTGNPSDSDEVRFGRIANPTVHIGLNQLRKLINAAIDAYGEPAQIVVELARDLKLSQDARREVEREQTKNEKENERRRMELRDVHNLPDSPENMLRLRLHDELISADPMSAACVYTGQCIARSQVFSEDIEVDHILPFAVSLDDGIANKVLCYRASNQEKGKRSPHQTWGGEADRYEEILRRAENLPPNKRWRFDADAMDRLRRDGDFLKRQLTDTAYLSKVARQYLQCVCNPDEVYAIPGRLTGFLRRKWGLNKLLSIGDWKNRNDHRHHTIDAVVAAVTDHSLLQRVSAAAAHSRHRLIEEMPPPWDGFRQELQTRIEKVIVSHRSDHGVQGQLHEDFAYGLVEGPEAEEIGNLVYRKSILDLSASEVARIRDRCLRARVTAFIAAHSGAGSIRDALAAFARETAVRRVRLLKQKKRFQAIRDRAGRAYKVFVPGENHHVEIFQAADGEWRGEGVSLFEANHQRSKTAAEANDSARVHVLDLHKGDLVSLMHDGQSRIFRIVQLAPDNGRVVVAQHQEGGELQKRHDDESDPFRWLFVSFGQLKRRGARRVRVDILGKTHPVALPT
jgi:CRISPR-associated endonuclease Csn1